MHITEIASSLSLRVLLSFVIISYGRFVQGQTWNFNKFEEKGTCYFLKYVGLLDDPKFTKINVVIKNDRFDRKKKYMRTCNCKYQCDQCIKEFQLTDAKG